MELRRLTYFACTAEVGSLGRAADVLRVAQPALSRQIRLLEQELGVQLFFRTRRGMRLTQEGQQLFDDLAGPLRQVRGALKTAQAVSSSLSGNVVVGLPQTVASLVGRPLLERATEQEPNITVQIVEGNSLHLVDWLVNGDLDVAVLYGPIEHDKLVTCQLLTEEMVLVGSADSALFPEQNIDFVDMVSLPLILPSLRNSIRRVSEQLAARDEAQMNIRYVVDSLAMQKELVGAGMGYTVLPRSAILKELELGSLTYARMAKPMTRTLVLATRQQVRSVRMLTRVQRIIEDVFQDLDARYGIGSEAGHPPKKADLGERG